MMHGIMMPAAPREIVKDAGIEPGTHAQQSSVTRALSQLSHHIYADLEGMLLVIFKKIFSPRCSNCVILLIISSLFYNETTYVTKGLVRKVI
jgi:hypothetical protein